MFNYAYSIRLRLSRRLVLIAIGGYLVSLPITICAQNCIPTNINGAVFNRSCTQDCGNLNFRIPHIKSTSDYVVTSIPYTPYPYVTAGGIVPTGVYLDDVFSPVINLPFPFCFYDSIFNKCTIGSNGIVTFDISNALLDNSWPLNINDVPIPIPYAGGTQNSVTEVYYPKSSIMGPYHDIYPLLDAGGLRRIEYSIVGTVPCRKFIISYYAVPMYDCIDLLCTEQIVLNESTGIVDIFIGDKPVCSDWNDGLAILGMQNWARDKAVAAPGKNCTVWRESNTGYRFIPSAGMSRFVTSQLYTLGGTLIMTADTATTTPGMLDLSFPNMCSPLGSFQYVVKTIFSACDNPASQLTSFDTITINKTNSLNATSSTTNTACGPPSGTITITVPAGIGVPPYTYILDGGAPVTGPSPHTFTNLVQGSHTVFITDASGGCSSSLTIPIVKNNVLPATVSSTPTACAAVATGTITLTIVPGLGTAPYTFSLDGGGNLTGPLPHTYSNIAAGNHTIFVIDGGGCVNTIPVNVAAGLGVTGTASSTATDCPSASDGTITATATAGIAPFTYQLDASAPQNGANPYTFINVAPGPHVVTIKDNIGCNVVLNVNVLAGPILAATTVSTPTSCNGAINGTITVTPVNGLAPYSFSLDGGTPIAGAPPYTFTNLAAGNHSIIVADAAGCVTNIINVMVQTGPSITTTVNKSNALCNGGASGTITITQPALGTAPFQYSLNGVNWQNGNTFTGLLAGTYTVFYRSANGCQGSQPVIIGEPTLLTATTATIPVVCNGENNGIISIAAAGGIPPYQYSIDGGSSWQSSNTFRRFAGNYIVTIRDANNCITTRQVILTEPVVLSAIPVNSNASCDGGNDGIIAVHAFGGNPGYIYSLDGTNFQASNLFYVAPGNYTVTVKDNLGCTTIFNTTVGLTVNLFLTPQTDLTICEGTSTQLQLSTNATLYSWTPATGLNNTRISNPVANPVTTTQYAVHVILGRCSTDDTMIVHVNAAPVPNAGPDGFICYGQSYQLQGSGGSQYTWTPAIYLNTTTGANPISTPSASTTYTLSLVVDALGCRSLTTDEVKVDVKKIMKVNTFPYDTVGYTGDQFQLLVVSAGNTYLWSPASGLNDPNIPNPMVTVGQVGDDATYQVVATNAQGCKGEGYVRVRVYKGPEIYVPTGFTPNGDGKNDKFTPFPVGISNYHYFKVFNRWGQLIFSTSRLNDGWDGRLGGSDQPAGVYVWMIEGVTRDNRVITKKGTVTLIR